MIGRQSRRWCLLTGLFFAFGAVAEQASSDPLPKAYVGASGDTIIVMTVGPLSQGRLSGSIDEIWIDSAGAPRQVRAAIEGVVSLGYAQLLLRYENPMRLAFAPRIDRVGDKWIIDPRDFAGATGPVVLSAGSAAEIRDLTDGAKTRQMARALLSVGREPPADQGCQCSDQKKAGVAAHTKQFSQLTAHLAQQLDRYAASLEVNLNAPQGIDDHAASDAYPAARMMIDVLGRESGRFAEQIEALQQECRQRRLSLAEAKTSEEISWSKACGSLASMGAQLNDTGDRLHGLLARFAVR